MLSAPPLSCELKCKAVTVFLPEIATNSTCAVVSMRDRIAFASVHKVKANLLPQAVLVFQAKGVQPQVAQTMCRKNLVVRFPVFMARLLPSLDILAC